VEYLINKYFRPTDNGNGVFMSATDIILYINEAYHKEIIRVTYSAFIGKILMKLGFTRTRKLDDGIQEWWYRVNQKSIEESGNITAQILNLN